MFLVTFTHTLRITVDSVWTINAKFSQTNSHQQKHSKSCSLTRSTTTTKDTQHILHTHTPTDTPPAVKLPDSYLKNT